MQIEKALLQPMIIFKHFKVSLVLTTMMSLVVQKKRVGRSWWTLFTHIPSRALNATEDETLSKMSFESIEVAQNQNGCFTSKLTTCLT